MSANERMGCLVMGPVAAESFLSADVVIFHGVHRYIAARGVGRRNFCSFGRVGWVALLIDSVGEGEGGVAFVDLTDCVRHG